MVSRENGEYKLKDQCTPKEENHGCLETVFIDGKLVKEVSLNEVIENSFR